MTDEVYTPAQASAVAGLPLKTVHKLIDGRLIRTHGGPAEGGNQRLLSLEQLVYLRLEAEGLRLLPTAARREIAMAIENSPGLDAISITEGSAILVQVKQVRLKVEQEVERLRKAQRMAVSDPEIMQGTPVYRGTRIPVELVAEMVESGARMDEILAGYPALDRERVELAVLYVRAFSRRGRPARRPWARQGLVRATYHSPAGTK